MLDEICPVQFVDGVNEAEEASQQKITTTHYSGVAIEYTPKLSYSLKRLGIFLTEQRAPEEDKFKVTLCLDHNNNPSDIVISEGEWIATNMLGDWQEVELKPRVVIRNEKYWLTIDVGQEGSIGLPIAKEGQKVALRFKKNKEWVIHNNKNYETDTVMLRFYGRLLPIVG